METQIGNLKTGDIILLNLKPWKVIETKLGWYDNNIQSSYYNDITLINENGLYTEGRFISLCTVQIKFL